VTSSIITALSAHEPPEEAASVPLGVPGVVVVDLSGVKVSEMSVGKDRFCFVGGRVEVTKRAAVGRGVSSEMVIQELRLKAARRINSQIFFMAGILLWKH
jgi:hypothetical protein